MNASSGSCGHLQCGRCGLLGTSIFAGRERRKCHQTVISGSGAFVLVSSSSSLQVYLSFRKSNKITFFFLQTYNMKKLFGKNTENRRVEEERWVLLVLLSATIFVAPRDLIKLFTPLWLRIIPQKMFTPLVIKDCPKLKCCLLHRFPRRFFCYHTILRTEKAHSSFIGKKFTVGKHHVVVEVGLMNV